MKAVFADTFYSVALLSERDEAHDKAVEASRHQKGQLVTTVWVLTEVGDALAAPMNRAAFMQLFDVLRNDPRAVIVPPNRETFDMGVALYAERPDMRWSLTDCISFTVMRKMNITEALTGDRHFEQAGFRALLR